MNRLLVVAAAVASLLTAWGMPARAEDKPGAAPAKAFIGTVESTASQRRPRLVVEGTHYDLKASVNADATVADTLARISKGEATGRFVVTGIELTMNDRQMILVDRIVKADP